MINTNISPRNNQEISKQYEYILLWMSGSLDESLDSHPLYIGKRFTENSRQILSVMIRYCSLFSTNYISHERIAKLTNTHHDTVLRTLHLFAQLGIIKITNRGIKQTCLYELGSFLHNPDVQWKLKEILPNLYWGIQTIIRRCKVTIGALVGHWNVTRKPHTAQLLNNKLRRIFNTKETHKIITSKPIQEPKTIQKDWNSDSHKTKFAEFAAILNGGG